MARTKQTSVNNRVEKSQRGARERAQREAARARASDAAPPYPESVRTQVRLKEQLVPQILTAIPKDWRGTTVNNSNLCEREEFSQRLTKLRLILTPGSRWSRPQAHAG